MKHKFKLRITTVSKAIGGMACLLFISGCAVGNQYAYVTEDVGLPISASKSPEPVAVGAMDTRPYVLSGNKSPDFVGLQRGGFGNPFDVTTLSKQPFGQDVAKVLSGLLGKSGYAAMVSTDFASPEAFVTALKQSDADRGFLIRINEWKTDIYLNITLHYDLELVVYDREGSVLCKAVETGMETIGGGKMTPSANAKSASLALSTKLSYLFNDPAVKAAVK